MFLSRYGESDKQKLADYVGTRSKAQVISKIAAMNRSSARSAAESIDDDDDNNMVRSRFAFFLAQ